MPLESKFRVELEFELGFHFDNKHEANGVWCKGVKVQKGQQCHLLLDFEVS
jgi:hypothetical protein